MSINSESILIPKSCTLLYINIIGLLSLLLSVYVMSNMDYDISSSVR